jgi:hypothetical protein
MFLQLSSLFGFKNITLEQKTNSNNLYKPEVMKKIRLVISMLLILAATSAFAQGNRNRNRNIIRQNVPVDSIIMSDPCILADEKTKTYYMTGTGGMMWDSKDLKYWNGPYKVTETDPESWMGPNPMIWAAELHQYKGKYYYFATFTNRAVKIDTVFNNVIERRASHVLVSDKPNGP